MSLTPVRVRGKRKTSFPIVPIFAMDDSLNRKKTRRSLAAVRASHSRRRRPTLQNLPVELLESILLHSGNLALPRASPLLGARLSGKATLLRLFIAVFCDTWNQCFGIPRSQLGHAMTNKGSLFSCEGDVSSQSDMLEMSWVDIDFILQAQQAWADRCARDRRYQHSVPLADGQDELSHAHDDEHRGGSSRFCSRDCFEVDYEQALRWPAFHVPSTAWGAQDVHPLVRMPTDLITGPWSEEKKRRLFWLTRGGIQLGAGGQTPVPWEVKLSCLDAAVISAEEPDPLIVNCLIGEWIFTGLPEDAARKQLVNLSRRIEWGGDPPETKDMLRRVAMALNLDLQLPEYYRIPG